MFIASNNVVAFEAQWGAISGDITDQADLKNSIDSVTDGVDDLKITISKAEYDELSSEEKLDPNKVYYVYDDEPDVGYYQVKVTLSSAVAAGGTVRVPASGTNEHIVDTATIVPVSDCDAKYSSMTLGSGGGFVNIVVTNAVASGSTIGVVIFPN